MQEIIITVIKIIRKEPPNLIENLQVISTNYFSFSIESNKIVFSYNDKRGFQENLNF